MNSDFVTLIFMAGIFIGFLFVTFVLPRRMAAIEVGRMAIYEEKCFVYWRLRAGFIMASSSPSTRLAFYDDFFIVAQINQAKFQYSQIKSYSQKKGLLPSSIKLNFADGRVLVIYPKNIEEIKSIFKEHVTS
jgi:hypothetical protein